MIIWRMKKLLKPNAITTFCFCLFFYISSFSFASEGKPDFSGVWAMEGWSADEWNVKPPYTAAGLAAREAWQASPEDDPAQLCIFNLVRITSAPLPHEIIQQDNRVTLLYEYQHQVRRAFMDGRTHPEGTYPTLMGHSIGHWEGDTLVIEAVGMESRFLRPQGMPHSDSLRVIEQRTLLDDGQSKTLETIIIDPEYYTEPWSVLLNGAGPERKFLTMTV